MTHSKFEFVYMNKDYTAHLTHIVDLSNQPHTEIDKIVHDDSGEEVEDDHLFNHVWDNYDDSELRICMLCEEVHPSSEISHVFIKEDDTTWRVCQHCKDNELS